MSRQIGPASAARVVAAVLLPPLGTYLARGASRDFAICCALTLFGYLPGVAFALWTVLDHRRAAIA